ncbi:MAG: ABC transporter ATP-binding protein [Bacteroidota bacterium]
MISIEDLSYSIGKSKILDNISVTFEGNQFVGLLGPNGAGKSTLLKLMSGAIHSKQGEISIEQKAIQNWNKKDLSQKRAVLSQNYEIAYNYSVRDLVLMGRYPFFEQVPNSKDIDIIERVLDFCGLKSFKDRSIKSLSGGELQRVHLARVLAQIEEVEKGILFLDEPINNLDLRYQHEIMQIALHYSRKGNLVVAVLHDLNIAFEYIDCYCFMNKGKIEAMNSIEKFVSKEVLMDIYGINLEVQKVGNRPSIVHQRNSIETPTV